MTKNLLIGIGSQGAGTLFLNDMLNGCSDVAMHPLIELHYFDTRYGVRDESVLKEFTRRQYEYENEKFHNEYNETFFNRRHETLLRSLHMLAEEPLAEIDYFDLFRPMSEESDFLGEITPEYMLLGEREVARMADYVGQESRIVLLVRDPVDRFLQSLILLLSEEFFRRPKAELEKELLEVFSRYAKWMDVQDRYNDYEEAFGKYRKHFKHVIMLSYEEFLLYPDRAIDRVETFLDSTIDRSRFEEIRKSYMEREDAQPDFPSTIRKLLEIRYRKSLRQLKKFFPEIYNAVDFSEEMERSKEDTAGFSLGVLNEMPLSLHIEGMTTEDFLRANPDLTEHFDPGDIEAFDLFMIEQGMGEVARGERPFHEEYQSFDEEMFLKLYPDIRRMVNDPENKIQSAFDHFCMIGYREILEGRRKWIRQETEKRCPVPIEKEYQWLQAIEKLKDPFYASIFFKYLDPKEYLAANPDLEEAQKDGVFQEVDDHILHMGGWEEILEGRREISSGTILPNMILGSVDRALVIDDHSFFLMGWLYLKEGEKVRKIYLSRGDSGIDISEQFSTFPRPDLDEVTGGNSETAGFYVYMESECIDLGRKEEYAVIVLTEEGIAQRFPFTLTRFNDIRKASEWILEPLRIDDRFFENMDRNVGPALRRYAAEHPRRIDESSIQLHEYGSLLENPEISVIVPLYGRVDFVEYQLSVFANDPYFRKRVELIYVLDDPRKHEELLRMAEGLYPMFNLPFMIVTYGENYGYAIANNIGARFARAKKLLLLNSDVMPRSRGWLPMLAAEYDDLDNAGAIGPRLLFEDNSIQHAGMEFEKNEIFGMWLNTHPGKGLPDMAKERKAREVPAVTGACMMIAKELYEEVGGLSENYLLGDFEDSDLCLKLIEKGKRNYYIPTVTLYHLERQSQNLFSDSSWKTKVTLYNGWQHHKRWNDLISKLKEVK